MEISLLYGIISAEGINMYLVNDKEFKCSVGVTLDIFNDKWKLGIIWHLLDSEKRFKELSEEVSEITQKTLTVKLKELESKNIIHREVFPEVPPKVVYSLTPIGEKLRPLLENMFNWGIEYVQEHGTITADNTCEVNLSSK